MGEEYPSMMKFFTKRRYLIFSLRGKLMKKIFVIALMIAVVAVITIGIFSYGTYTVKAHAATMIVAVSPLKSVIESRLISNAEIDFPDPISLLKNNVLPEGSDFPVADKVIVSEDGTITMISNKFGIRIELRPEIDKKAVVWSCSGTPREKLAPFCKLRGGPG